MTPEPSPPAIPARLRRLAFALLLAGATLAVGTPVVLSSADPYLAVYLMHPGVLLVTLLPYVVCGLVWLPRRSRAALRVGVGGASLLLATALVVHVPMLFDAPGGDMVSLLFAAISFGATAFVLVASAVAEILLRFAPGGSFRRRRRAPSA